MRLSHDSSMGRPAIDLSTLTAAEKVELIDELWQSLGPDDLALTAPQRQELDRRLDRLDREGPSGRSWLQVREEIDKVSK